MKTSGGVISADKVGIIHIIGIGGIGMSGIAEILHTYGYHVQGADLQDSYVTERLRSLGINVMIGHKAENIVNANIIVKSTAVSDLNPEIIEAIRLGLPIITRSEMLAELMRFKNPIAISGTHGKTTTTSLISTVLMESKLNPTVINGGIINAVGSNVHIGSGDLMVVEADESDGTFIMVPAYIAVVTNIDEEHMNYYGTFDRVKKAYMKFIKGIPFYGFAVLCVDHDVVRELAAKIKDRRVVSYGIHHKADLMANNISVEPLGCKFDVKLSDKFVQAAKLSFDIIKDVFLPIYGMHNVQNCLASIAVALDMGISREAIKSSLAGFAGVRRRFTTTGEVDGIMVIDDYAHHPEEIKATLSAASQLANMRGGNIIVVLQPHRFTRLRDLMEEFSTSIKDADYLFVADLYSAGENEIDGVNSLELIKKISAKFSEKQVIHLKNEQNIAKMINDVAKPKDLVVFLGAGSITQWAYALPVQLRILRDNNNKV